MNVLLLLKVVIMKQLQMAVQPVKLFVAHAAMEFAIVQKILRIVLRIVVRKNALFQNAQLLLQVAATQVEQMKMDVSCHLNVK